MFISLPSRDNLVKFIKEKLTPEIEKKWPKLRVVSYLDLKQGRWLKKIEGMISKCNVVVAFLDDLNSNVIYEIGQATSLGKPIVMIAPNFLEIPSMLNSNQVIKYSNNILGKEDLKNIVAAIDESVFSALNREKMDKRTQIQKNLLIGITQPPEYYYIQNGSSRKITEEQEDQALEKAEEAYHNADFSIAADILESCIKRGSNSEEVFHLLADTFFLWGEGNINDTTKARIYKRMLSMAEKGITICPNSVLLKKDRGLALMRTGNITEAKSQFEQLLFDHPEIPFVPYNLACINAMLGDVNSAVIYLRKAIELREDYQELARIDSDFDSIWDDVLFQALVFQVKY